MLELNKNVSIVTTVKNGAAFLREMLFSVYNQSYQFYEHIIVDDGSKDNTLLIVEEFMESNPGNKIRIFSTTGIGRGKALNLGVSEAFGHWIAIIDADDLWHKEKLSRQMAIITEYNIDVLCTETLLFSDPNSVFPVTEFTNELVKIETARLLKANQLSHSSVMLKKSLSHYNDKRKSQLDYDLWLRLQMRGKNLVKLGDILCYHRIHDDQSFEGKMGKIYRWRSFKLKIYYSLLSFDLISIFYNLIKFIFDVLFPRQIRLSIRKWLLK